MLTATGAVAGLAAGVLLQRLAAWLLGVRERRPAAAAATAAVTAALWILAAVTARHPAAAAYAWALTALAVLITVTDIECRTIPNAALLAAVVLWVPLYLLARPGALSAALAGMIVFAGPLGVAAWLRPGAMGLGDVKLAAVLGLYLGFPLAGAGLMLGALAGGLGGAAVLLHPTGGRKATMPYGPFLAAGAVAALLWGAPLLRAAGWG